MFQIASSGGWGDISVGEVGSVNVMGGQSSPSEMVGFVRVTGLGIVFKVIKLVLVVGVVNLDYKHLAQNIHGLHVLNHQSIEKSRDVTTVMDRHTDQGWTPWLLGKPGCPRRSIKHHPW